MVEGEEEEDFYYFLAILVEVRCCLAMDVDDHYASVPPPFSPPSGGGLVSYPDENQGNDMNEQQYLMGNEREKGNLVLCFWSPGCASIGKNYHYF